MDTRLYGRTETKQKTTLHAPLIREEQSMAPGQQIMQQPVRQTELDKEIIRLESFGSTLTEIEKNRLKELAPPEPDFQILSKEELGAKKKAERSQYKKNLKAYESRKKKWEEETQNTWKDKTQAYEKNVKTRAALTQEVSNYGQKLSEAFPVHATVDEMDQSLRDNTDTQVRSDKVLDEQRLKLGKVDTLQALAADRWELLKKTDLEALYAIDAYAHDSATADVMNEYLRTKKEDEKNVNEIRQAGQIQRGLSAMPGIPNDIVVRRGVGRGTLAHMYIDAQHKKDQEQQPVPTEDQIKNLLTEENIKNGIILEEKGFCSTSFAENGGFAAANLKTHKTGIEFIILVRKGTQAIDISQHATFQDEREVLLNAGTRFRVVSAFWNDGSKNSQRNICMGPSDAWKIYLETIPSADSEGEERKEEAK